MLAMEENHLVFNELNTVALGIGVDAVPSNKAWAQSMDNRNTRLLSDFWPHGEVARLYGVFREKDGFAERANIIVDERHKVVFTKTHPTSQLPDFYEITKLLSGG